MASTMALLAQLEAAKMLYPSLSPVLDHRSAVSKSTWGTRVETGKSIEVLSICGLLSAAASMNFSVLIPSMYFENPDLFYIRNTVPRSHDAQAGHDATILDSIPLSDRFIAALTPKAILEHASGRKFLAFREGLPAHFISVIAKGGVAYLERPDIIIMEGDFDIQVEEAGVLGFHFHTCSGTLAGSLRIRNDTNLPLKSISSNFSNEKYIYSIIECSVSKGRVKAEDQLATYLELFGGAEVMFNVFVNGRDKPCPAYDHEILIDPITMDSSRIARNFFEGFIPLVNFLDQRS